MKFSQRLTAGVVAVLLFGAINSAMAQARQTLRGHVPEIVARLQSTGRLPGATHLNLAIGLPLRNEQQLDELIQQIYDPASPNYRHYLTPEQFTERFGPSEKDYRLAADFFAANGFKVTPHANRVVLDVSGPAADVEKVFHVSLLTYRHPTESRSFFAPDAEPAVDLAVPILHVSGLDNYSLPRPKFQIKNANEISESAPRSGSGSGTNGSYLGNDFRAAYLPGVTTNQLSGAGQIVGLLEFEGYYSNDIAIYENLAGLPNVSITNFLIDGFSGNPSSVSNNGITEVSLDIEMVIAMAPNVSKIIVYEEPNGNPWPDILNPIVTNNLARTIGCSWGFSSPGPTDPTSEGIFKQMAVQGQSFFNASGDTDAFTSSGVPFPSESTNITQVGGTTLTTSGAGGSWVSETVWNWGGGQGSCGGVSQNYLIPIWQQGIDMTANQGSATKRNVPDVALTADNIFVVANNNHSYTGIGGTSVAAPLWAGFIALVNQKAAAAGQPPAGFINPAIYAIGKSAAYTADFHDITTGNNFKSGSPTKYAATSGYDLCTGWGTPNGMNLITALATPDVLGILPGAGFAATGPVGGPLNVSGQNFSLTNSGGSSLNWSVFGVPFWLDASSSGGTLASGGGTTITLNVNSTGSNLLAGIYATNLTFTNLTSHITQSRPVILQLGQSAVQNGGFETGDFTFWVLNGHQNDSQLFYNGVVNAGTFTDGSGTNFVHSGTYGAVLGDTILAHLSQTIPTLPGQSYLISFWMNNIGGATPNQFQVNWNTNASATNTIFNQVNVGAINTWTNMLFVVTAAGTNTILQFGARNDNYFFGLDDVSVAPIPAPSFRTFGKTNNLLNFMWNSLAGVQYQLQFSTNLTQTNWVVLGGTITATNGTATVTNGIGPDPTRFYRIKRLP